MTEAKVKVEKIVEAEVLMGNTTQKIERKVLESTPREANLQAAILETTLNLEKMERNLSLLLNLLDLTPILKAALVQQITKMNNQKTLLKNTMVMKMEQKVKY